MKQKILVTGGLGYIGSHTVIELINSGFEVVIIDNLYNSELSVLQRIEQITNVRPAFADIDLTDKKSLSDFFKTHSDIEATIHFAAAKAVGESVNKPLFYYSNNLIGVLNLLAEIKNIVFSSSCTVYGQPAKLPVTENTPFQKHESPYGNTKKITEEVLADICKTNTLQVIALRYFNPIGAHKSALIGELPRGVPQNLMPFITQTAIGKRESLSVFGNDYNTPDGTCIRDYIHVTDLALSHIAAVKRLLNNNRRESFEAFNIGTGNGFSVMEVINSFEKTSGKKLNYHIAPRRKGDIEQIWADPSLANTKLGWKAEKSLDEMTYSAWQWELANYEKK